MQDELSPDTKEQLNEATSTWEDWTPSPIGRPTPKQQLGGITNLSFLVTDGPGQWVVRLNSDVTDGGISRSNELAALASAHRAGISPPMVFSNQNFLVSKYCPGDMPTLMDLAEIGSLFADIHSLNVSVPPIDLLTHLEAYQFQVRDMQITPDRDVADCYSRVMAMPKPKITTRVLCHQDLTLSNMIKTNSGIVAIDWEYARQSDPAYDLAVFTYTHELTQKQFSDLLNSYARHEAELPQRVDYFQRVYAMIEIFWSLIRGGEINTGKLRALLDSA